MMQCGQLVQVVQYKSSWLFNILQVEGVVPSSHSNTRRLQAQHISTRLLDHHCLIPTVLCCSPAASFLALSSSSCFKCSFKDIFFVKVGAAAAVLCMTLESVRQAAMARSGMVVVVLVLAMLAMGETAESPPNCDSAASALLPCYSYVTGPDVKPPTDCCGGLSSLNTNSPTCLCQLITQLNSSVAAEPSVNITKAFNLPKDCAITLKTSDCPALANLPLAPPAGVTPTPAAPTTASPGPTAAAGSGTGVPGNDVSRLLPTNLMIGVAAAAVVGVQALIF